MIPGEIFAKDGEIELNAGRPTITIEVANTGDRPIQVGSHYHFAETNAALRFDRDKARGFRLDIPPVPPCASNRARAYGHARRDGGLAHHLRLPPTRDGKTLTHGQEDCARRLCSNVRPHDRRQSAFGRHRSRHRSGARFHDLRRRGEIRRRQSHSRRHGPIADDECGGRDGHRHHQRARARRHRHLQSRHRLEERPYRSHRQGGQPRHPAQTSPSSSAPAPRSSRARAKSSQPVASTHTSTSFALSRSRRRSPPA